MLHEVVKGIGNNGTAIMSNLDGFVQQLQEAYNNVEYHPAVGMILDKDIKEVTLIEYGVNPEEKVHWGKQGEVVLISNGLLFFGYDINLGNMERSLIIVVKGKAEPRLMNNEEQTRRPQTDLRRYASAMVNVAETDDGGR